MQRILLSVGTAVLLSAGSITAYAATDTGTTAQNSQPMQATGQSDMSHLNIRQQIQDQLTKDGYSGVTITPSSFLVRAKDKQGNPVEMVIGPDSFTEVTEIAPKTASGSNGAASNKAASASSGTGATTKTQ